jgi:hypothetical protein
MARFLMVEDDESLTAFLRCNREAEGLYVMPAKSERARRGRTS